MTRYDKDLMKSYIGLPRYTYITEHIAIQWSQFETYHNIHFPNKRNKFFNEKFHPDKFEENFFLNKSAIRKSVKNKKLV